ncbi:hypothetical protein B0H11DRAFT_1910448 [Mycena galericulata]|nr:hypothetical protein B0H11DRAFT_1910448 [Mycena galericulata]
MEYINACSTPGYFPKRAVLSRSVPCNPTYGTHRSFQNTQIFTLSQQLRDTQATVESLRNQITVMQNRTHDVEHARDHAEFMLEVYEGRVSGHVKQERRMQCYRDHPDIIRVNSSACCETIYPDGGACTEWFSDPSFTNHRTQDRTQIRLPVYAAAVEQVFSGGRDTIGLRHASLKAETIEILMFVKVPLRLAREASKKREQLLEELL